MGNALVAIETGFVDGQEAVHETEDGMGVFLARRAFGRRRNDVGVAAVVDDPLVVLQARDAEVGGGWAAGAHLV